MNWMELTDEQKADADMVDSFAHITMELKKATKIIVFLAIFFHQHSFPLCQTFNQGTSSLKSAESEFEDHENSFTAVTSTKSGNKKKETNRVGCCGVLGYLLWFLGRIIYGEEKKPITDDDYGNMIIARKRSAVVSLLFVDTMFLIMRTIIISYPKFL